MEPFYTIHTTFKRAIIQQCPNIRGALNSPLVVCCLMKRESIHYALHRFSPRAHSLIPAEAAEREREAAADGLFTATTESKAEEEEQEEESSDAEREEL